MAHSSPEQAQVAAWSPAPEPSALGMTGVKETSFNRAGSIPSSSASRVPKPLSQTAENVTVITRDQIEALNAHTLADISAIPAQVIERIEIVKGAASSAWGQSLGGVIAVTTKSPERRPIGGSAYTAVGERGSTDSRLELSGTVGSLGYYLSGGYLGSDGVRPQPNSHVNSTTEFGKLTWDLPDRGKLWATFLYNHANLGVLYAPAYDFQEDINSKQLNATIGYSPFLLPLPSRHIDQEGPKVALFPGVQQPDNLLLREEPVESASGFFREIFTFYKDRS